MRHRSAQPGIRTWHSFSAGAHYDPDNVAFGPIVGLDEHTVDPGAGFDWHGHRGVFIVSYILEGMLRHQDSDGAERFVGPGALLVQSAGDGIRHRETNASDSAPLRFVQITILGDGPRGVELTSLPTTVAGVDVAVARGEYHSDDFTRRIVMVLSGEFRDGDAIADYGPGDEIRLESDRRHAFLEGDGAVLILALTGPT